MWMSLLRSSGCAARIASASSSDPCHVAAWRNFTRASSITKYRYFFLAALAVLAAILAFSLASFSAALARALITRPKVLLADEPTGDLDNRTSEVIFELIARLHRDFELSSVIATHNFGFARRCHRVLRLESGKIEEVAPASLAE